MPLSFMLQLAAAAPGQFMPLSLFLQVQMDATYGAHVAAETMLITVLIIIKVVIILIILLKAFQITLSLLSSRWRHT